MEAIAKLDKANEAFRTVREQYERCRDELADAISEALLAGAGPAFIERRVVYNRVHIDRIRRKAGIPAKRAATVQRIPKEKPE